MLTNLPIPYDICVTIPNFTSTYTMGSSPVKYSVLLNTNIVFNVKALVGTFNQEKALVTFK